MNCDADHRLVSHSNVTVNLLSSDIAESGPQISGTIWRNLSVQCDLKSCHCPECCPKRVWDSDGTERFGSHAATKSRGDCRAWNSDGVAADSLGIRPAMRAKSGQNGTSPLRTARAPHDHRQQVLRRRRTICSLLQPIDFGPEPVRNKTASIRVIAKASC